MENTPPPPVPLGLRQRENCVAGLQGAKERQVKKTYWHIYTINDQRENKTSSDSPVNAFWSTVDNVFITVFCVHVFQFIGHESRLETVRTYFSNIFFIHFWIIRTAWWRTRWKPFTFRFTVSPGYRHVHEHKGINWSVEFSVLRHTARGQERETDANRWLMNLPRMIYFRLTFPSRSEK